VLVRETLGKKCNQVSMRSDKKIQGEADYLFVLTLSLVGKFNSKIRAVKSYQVLEAGVVVKGTKP